MFVWYNSKYLFIKKVVLKIYIKKILFKKMIEMYIIYKKNNINKIIYI